MHQKMSPFSRRSGFFVGLLKNHQYKHGQIVKLSDAPKMAYFGPISMPRSICILFVQNYMAGMRGRCGFMDTLYNVQAVYIDNITLNIEDL